MAHDEREREEFREIIRLLRGIIHFLNLRRSGTVTFGGNHNMNQVLQVGQTIQCVAHEFQGLLGTGLELPLAGNISWLSDDPSVVSVDPVTGLATGVAVNKTDAQGNTIPVNIIFTDDALPSLIVAPGTLTDTAPVAQSGTVSFQPAVTPGPAARAAAAKKAK